MRLRCFPSVNGPCIVNIKMNPIRKNKKSNPKKKTLSKRKSNENSELDVRMDTLRNLLKRKWKVFRVSLLHNFSFNKFRFYEKKLNEGINLKKKMGITYESKFTLTGNLKPNEQCAECIQVEIVRDDSHRIYLGHLISWSAATDVTNGSKSLPILLVDAKEDEIHGIHQVLCKIFDCDIQPVTFSFYALITFFVKLLETSRNSPDVASPKHIVIEYKVPNCEDKDRIKISLGLEETAVAFAVILDSSNEKYQDITTTEIIWEFYNKILNHIYHVYKMDLILAELQKIIFPDAFITADGQIKMNTAEAATNALNVLGEFTPLDAITNI